MFFSSFAMSESGKENDSYIQKLTTGIENDIAIIDKQIQEMSDGSCGANYRCIMCNRLTIDHTNGVIKHCKGRKCGIEEYANSIVQQKELLAQTQTKLENTKKNR